MRVGIIGAGIAGLACAEVLESQGFDVSLYDKGRGPGGRMSTRRLSTPVGEVSIDHGAQYFTARDPRFIKVVHGWWQRGLVAPWPEANTEAWVGLPAMNAVIKDMASSLNVAFGSLVKAIERRDDGWRFKFDSGGAGPFEIAAIAVPAEQAAPLLSLHDFEMACVALRARSKPCWTGMYAFSEPLRTPLNIVKDSGIVAWAARNNAKPCRETLETWVVQAQPSWSEARCENGRDEIARDLLYALGIELGLSIPVPLAQSAHLWRFAMTNGAGETALWNAKKGLAACGDWLLGPRVEAAWVSGHVLGQRMVKSIKEGCRLTI